MVSETVDKVFKRMPSRVNNHVKYFKQAPWNGPSEALLTFGAPLWSRWGTFGHPLWVLWGGVPWELLVTFGAAAGVLKRSVGLRWDLSGGVLGPLRGPLGSSGVSRASLRVLWLSLGGCLGVRWETFGYLDGFGMLLGSFGGTSWGPKPIFSDIF